MAVLIGGLAPRATVTDDDMLQLEGAFGIHSLTLEGRNLVFVAGLNDDGITSFQINSDGTLSSPVNLRDSIDLELDDAANFGSTVIGNFTYLYVSGAADSGISVFQVYADGTLRNIQNITDDLVLELDDTAGKMSVASVGGAMFLIATAKDDNGITVFQIGPDGTLQFTDSITDDDTFELNDAFDTAVHTVDGRTYVYVAGEDDNGLSVFELSATGKLALRQNVVDDPVLNLGGAWGVVKATVGSATYLVASGHLDDGISVFSIDDSGRLSNVFNLRDDAARGLDGPAGLSTFTLDGETFVSVPAYVDSALTVFHLGADGTLTEVTAIFDSPGTALLGTTYSTFAAVGEHPFLLATGSVDDGVTSFEIGGGDDALLGTDRADFILGLGGNDVLDGAGGIDRMMGGSGDDTYVVDSTGDLVEERAARGTDQVRSSVSYTLGSDVENLQLLGLGDLYGFGNEFGNLLSGNAGANRIAGLGGRDWLYGADGRDDLRGGSGRDHLLGGQGRDNLLGGAGRDILRGNGGDDDFVFTRLSDSGSSNASRDRIEGFSTGDRIVLRDIDAVRGESGDQAFHLDLGGPFEAGGIRVRDNKAGLLVEVNVDQDAKAEMTILLADSGGTLDRGDFVF